MTKTALFSPDGQCPYGGKDCPICFPPPPPLPTAPPIRTFETGATRDTENGKLDFEGFLSPLVLLRYAEYMHEHRKQGDGQLRAGDNWQKGIPRDAYMKSMLRHVMDVWLIHRDQPQDAQGTEDITEALCAVIFNAMGYLFNELTGLE